MSKRTDIHRPSAINPDEYEYVAFEFIPIGKFTGDIMADCEFLQQERATIQRHMKETGGTYSRHEHGGNCHVCGAHAIYTVLFYHRITNTYIRTGQDCAEKMDLAVGGNYDVFRTSVKNALDHQAGKQKAQAILERDGLSSAWAVYKAYEYGQPKQEEIVADIVGKLVQYGSVSDKSLNYVRSLVNQIENRAAIEAQRKAETDAAAPVPTGRITIEGIVLTTKNVDSAYGPVVKMLVQHDSGYKVWGTKPGSFVTKRGDRISFTATVTSKPEDLKFGYFSRPTNAVLVGPAEVANFSIAA
jgi:hypothetical protein